MATIQHHGTVCKTCRRRGKKCDKRLPQCTTCITKGIQCEGYVLRWSGVASRGKLAGKSIPVSDESATKGAQRKPVKKDVKLDLNLTSSLDKEAARDQLPSKESKDGETMDIDLEFSSQLISGSQVDADNMIDLDLLLLESGDFSLLDFDLIDLQNNLAVVQVPNPTLPRSLSPLNVPSEIKFILDYCITSSVLPSVEAKMVTDVNEVAPRLCVDNSSVKNPYIEYIMPLAIEVPSLMYACASLAACQFDIRLGDKDYHWRSLKFKGKAMNRLQEALYSDKRAKDQGTLATILMLSLCDIALGGFAGFHTHFLGAKKLIEMRQSERTPDSFVEQNLAWLDTMSATSHFRSPIFSADEIADYTGATRSAETREWSYDVFPCPVQYFEIVHKVVELYKSQADPNCTSAETLEKVAYFKNVVLTLPMQLHRGEYWLHLTEAYRFAIVLYLLRLFRCGNDPDEISWLAGSVFFHAQSTVPSTGWADQLLWPLFHAALEIKDDTRKNWLRQRAAAMQLSGGFRNVESAMAVLESVWAGTNSRSYMDLMAGEGTSSILLV